MSDDTDNTAKAPAKEGGGMPQYKLLSDAYLNERYRKEGESVYYRGRPEWYMEPVNDAARKMVEKHAEYLKGYRDPIQGMTIVSPEAVAAQAKAAGA